MGAAVAPLPQTVTPQLSPLRPVRAVLLGVSPHVRSVLTPVLRDAGYDVVDAPEGARIDTATLVVVEADSGDALLRALPALPGVGRSLARPYIIAVTGWWNENEVELRRIASAVLHAPLREGEYRPVLRAVPTGMGEPLLTARALAN